MKNVLVVVDMQRDFVDGALGSNEAVAIVDNVVNKINEFDGDIIVTYDTHQDNYMETPKEAHRLMGFDDIDFERFQMNQVIMKFFDVMSLKHLVTTWVNMIIKNY